ncbi:MAG: phosphoglycerate dehydrogenase, partial [Patescibacteria group bacterium]|nr:phosphoglycerate dehydrogenase [Patescibacteria group bacterium]
LDELSRIALTNHPQKDALTQKIAEITKQGMEGKIDFPTSLAKRMALFSPTLEHINELIAFLQEHITPSVTRNKEFFVRFADRIYIISGGFAEYIIPVVKTLGIPQSHVLANKFITNKKGEITGFDPTNPLAKKNGKPLVVKKLKLSTPVCVIGDGITDYQIKEQNQADMFFAFTENVARKGVIAKADRVIQNFDELLHTLDLPRSQSYPKSKMHVLLLENISEEAVTRFTAEGFQVETYKAALSENDLLEKIEDVSILGIRSKTEITQKVMQKAHKLLAIGAFCIGTNQIDLPATTKKGIAAFNAPYSNTRSVVELAMGEIIMLARKACDKSAQMHKGVWDKSAAGCFEIRGKKLGIVGYGNIGTQLSVVAESLGMHVYYYDVADKLALGNATRCSSLDELLKTCDVVTVHVDGSKTNKHLFGKREFDAMKQGSLFLNLSRGHVVDIDALQHSLASGHIAGAAVDVFPKEPKSNSDPFISPLQNLPNVILTPHIGGSTEEAQRNIGEFVSTKLMQFINTGNTILSVNFPELSLPPQGKAHRFIHVHENIPGVLAHINNFLSKYTINILGQYL